MKNTDKFINDFIEKEGKKDPMNLFTHETVDKFLNKAIARMSKKDLIKDNIWYTKTFILIFSFLRQKETLNKNDLKQLKQILNGKS